MTHYYYSLLLGLLGFFIGTSSLIIGTDCSSPYLKKKTNLEFSCASYGSIILLYNNQITTQEETECIKYLETESRSPKQIRSKQQSKSFGCWKSDSTGSSSTHLTQSEKDNMYQLESTIFTKNEWQIETIPMILRYAEKILKDRLAKAEGRRRYRLIKV